MLKVEALSTVEEFPLDLGVPMTEDDVLVRI